jgi:hypothetical protein
MEIWHRGRSAEGIAGVISGGGFYSLCDDGIVRGFVEFSDMQWTG